MLTRSLESKKIQKDHAMEIEKAQNELEKRNMSEASMLKYKAIQLARSSYAGKYVSKTNMLNLSSDDPSTAALAGLLAKYDLCKKATGVTD